MKRLVFLLAMLALVACMSNSTFAVATPAVSWTTLSHAEAWSDCTIGYDFVVGAQDIYVTELGYYDELGDGLQQKHDIGIWSLDGSLLVSATVNAGTLDNLVDKYRYTNISVTKLNANTTYTIGGQNAGEIFGRSDVATGFAVNSLLGSVGPSKYTYGAGLNKPVTGPYWTGGLIYAGPNMMISSVPEASTLIGFGSALAMAAPGMIGWLRRRRA